MYTAGYEIPIKGVGEGRVKWPLKGVGEGRVKWPLKCVGEGRVKWPLKCVGEGRVKWPLKAWVDLHLNFCIEKSNFMLYCPVQNSDYVCV